MKGIIPQQLYLFCASCVPCATIHSQRVKIMEIEFKTLQSIKEKEYLHVYQFMF